MAFQSDLRKIIKEAEAQGWRHEQTQALVPVLLARVRSDDGQAVPDWHHTPHEGTGVAQLPELPAATRVPGMMKMEFRGTITVRRPASISNEEYSRVLAALNQRHEELGAVGGGGERDTAVFILSTDRYRYPAPAAAELVDAVVDALKYADLEDAWPVSLDLEEVEVEPEEPPAPRVAHG